MAKLRFEKPLLVDLTHRGQANPAQGADNPYLPFDAGQCRSGYTANGQCQAGGTANGFCAAGGSKR
jgi:hypothetical protein